MQDLRRVQRTGKTNGKIRKSSGSKWLVALSEASVTVTAGACRPRDDFQEAMQNERIGLVPWTS